MEMQLHRRVTRDDGVRSCFDFLMAIVCDQRRNDHISYNSTLQGQTGYEPP
jgi:hypothetical protein